MALTHGRQSPSTTNERDEALLWVNGSVALDTQARATFKAALQQAGITVVAEKLLAAGTPLSPGVGASQSSTKPRLVILVSTIAGTEEGLEALLRHDNGPNSLAATFGDCFTISADSSAIEALFPHSNLEEALLKTAVDSDLPPDHERRVFTFDSAEPEGKDGQVEEAEEEDDDDQVAENLIVIPKSPAPGSSKSYLGQSMPASYASKDGSTKSKEGPRSPRAAGEATQRPASAFKARKTPSTAAPSITPRLSKAAALRMGIELPEKRPAKSEMDENGEPVEKEEAFVPGTVRRPVTPPKSLSRPAMAPRQNRASALRTTSDGSVTREPAKPRKSVGTSQRSLGFIGLPGFAKRAVTPPSEPMDEWKPAPAQNKAFRQSFQDGSFSRVPEPTQRRESLTTKERAAAFRSSFASSASPALSAIGSARSGTASPAPLSPHSMPKEFYEGDHTPATVIAHKTSRNLARPPSIAPRPNKAAELRLAAQKATRA